MDVIVRGCREDDLDEVLALWRVAAAVPSVSDDRESLERLLARDPEAMLVAEADGRVVGTLIAGFDGWRGGYYRLAVHPDVRRAGIGQRLVRAGEERLRNLGVRRVHAIVMREHDHATAFWRALGYRHDERTHRYIADL